MSEIDLRQYVAVARKWLWLIVAAVIIGAGASLIVSLSMPRIYQATAVLMVGPDGSNPRVTPEELGIAKRAAASYASMATRQPILEAAVTTLSLPTTWQGLHQRVLAFHTAGSNIIELRVVDNSPERAKAIADEIVRQLVAFSVTSSSSQPSQERRQFIQQQLDALQKSIKSDEGEIAKKQAELEQETSARGVLEIQDQVRALETKVEARRQVFATLLENMSQTNGPTSLTVLDRPFVPSEPLGPNVLMNVLMAAATSLLLALGAIVLIEFFLSTVDTPERVTQALNLPLLGKIPVLPMTGTAFETLMTATAPYSHQAEAFRMLRTNVLLTWDSREPAMILVTSPSRGDGKSVTAANLAVSFAQAGQQTILVDADLRQPTVHSRFGIPNWTGLVTLLRDESLMAPAPGRDDSLPLPLLDRYLAATDVPGLRVLPSGPSPDDPSELLGSRRMLAVLRSLRTAADVIILDTPPVLPVADTTVLTAAGMDIVLVVRAGRTRTPAARQARDLLLRGRSRIMGVVLNGVTGFSPAYLLYGYLARNATGKRTHEADQPLAK